MLHVIFTPEGIPAHISADPRPGSEPVDGLDLAFLIEHRRTEAGEWVKRDPVIPPEPTAEELAARAEAEYQAALDARVVAINEAIQTSEVHRQYTWGEITLTTYRAEVAKIVASFPMPER